MKTIQIRKGDTVQTFDGMCGQWRDHHVIPWDLLLGQIITAMEQDEVNVEMGGSLRYRIMRGARLLYQNQIA